MPRLMTWPICMLISGASRTRASSGLGIGIERIEFDAGVVEFELPVDSALPVVAVGAPDGEFPAERLNRRESSSAQALPGQKTQAELAKTFVVLEATARYERQLVAGLADTGFIVAAVNPRQVRDFAKALGNRAKTDSIDARVIARFGDQVRPLAIPNSVRSRPNSTNLALGDGSSLRCGPPRRTVREPPSRRPWRGVSPGRSSPKCPNSVSSSASGSASRRSIATADSPAAAAPTSADDARSAPPSTWLHPQPDTTTPSSANSPCDWKLKANVPKSSLSPE